MSAMSKKQVSMRITLKSDLCAGSGEGFSSGIDQDVCFDRKGLPVIPGRRLKGCLREAAELARCTSIDEIFGCSGSSVAGSIRVGNAVLARDMRKKVVPNDVQRTLEAYTSLRAMTRIDEVTGSAQDNTLRVVRVVRHFVEGEELVFEASVFIDGEREKELRRIAPAMRNIGLMRNKGLGAVRCEIVDSTDAPDGGGSFEGVTTDEGGHQVTALPYQVHLEAPVMLPRDNGNRSTDCISGTAVLGCFASELKGSERFDKLFLEGRVRFSPLYPVDERGMRCLPAPSFIAKVKGGADDGQYCYVGRQEGDGELRPLKSGFVGSGWLPVDVQTETIYHHSRQGEGTLYTQYCLSEGQTFAGFVDCDSELVEAVRGVLAGGTLSFGRSKSAQYALCSVEEADVSIARRGTVVIEAGGSYALVLDSDLLLRDERGSYTTDFAQLKGAIAGALGSWANGIEVDVDAASLSDRHLVTTIKTCEVSGYNAKWNQKKPHVRAFAAGSTIAFRVPEGTAGCKAPGAYHLGDRQAEGYGRLVLVRLDGTGGVKVATRPREDGAGAERLSTETELLRRETIALARRNHTKALTRSLVGRLALMVRESTDEQNLVARFDSIRSDERKSAAKAILKEVKRVVGRGSDEADWPLLQECLSLYLTILRYVAKRSDNGKEGE